MPGQARVRAAGPGEISLWWRPSTDNVGVIGYRIYDAATRTVLFETTGAAGVVGGIASGTHRVYVRALDPSGNESWRSGITTVTVS